MNVMSNWDMYIAMRDLVGNMNPEERAKYEKELRKLEDVVNANKSTNITQWFSLDSYIKK